MSGSVSSSERLDGLREGTGTLWIQTGVLELKFDCSDQGVSAILAQAYNIEESMVVKMRRGKVGDKHVDWRQVTHVSRTITDADNNYSQIEGESPANYYGIWSRVY